jgi:hypothetical protein
LAPLLSCLESLGWWSRRFFSSGMTAWRHPCTLSVA